MHAVPISPRLKFIILYGPKPKNRAKQNKYYNNISIVLILLYNRADLVILLGPRSKVKARVFYEGNNKI